MDKWAMEPHPVMHIRMTSSTHHPGALLSTCRCLDSTHAALLMMGPSHAGGTTTKANAGNWKQRQQNQPVVLAGLDDLSTISVHEMLVDPANNDFRPKWGSHLHVLNAGAYDADDSNPWTAGISWTYAAPSAPVASCSIMLTTTILMQSSLTVPVYSLPTTVYA